MAGGFRGLLDFVGYAVSKGAEADPPASDTSIKLHTLITLPILSLAFGGVVVIERNAVFDPAVFDNAVFDTLLPGLAPRIQLGQQVFSPVLNLMLSQEAVSPGLGLVPSQQASSPILNLALTDSVTG